MNKITRKDLEFFKDFPRIDTYQTIATKSAIYPGQYTALGLAYVALKLNGEAGELAEHVGKAMRDDDLTPVEFLREGDDMVPQRPIVRLNRAPTETRRALIIKEIGDVLWYLSAACDELGISLSEAAAINLEKLCDRTERDQLRGSGDER